VNAVRAAFAVLLAALWFAFAAAAPAKAFDDSDIQRIDIAIKSARAALNEIISTTDPASINEDAIAQQRNALGKLKTTATATAKELDQPQADVTAQVTQLGPLPEEGIVEQPEIAAQRKALGDRSALLSGLRKQLELVGVEADQQLSRLSAIERDQFLNRVFASEDSILDPRMWWASATAATQFVLRVGNLLSNWWKQVSPEANFGVLAVTLLSIASLLFAINRMRRLFRGIMSTSLSEPGAEVVPASHVRRLWHVIFNYLRLVVAVLLGFVLVMIGLQAAGLVTSQFELLVSNAAEVIATTLVYTGAAFMVCQPSRPAARLVAIEEGAARSLVLITALASAVYYLGSALTNIATALSIPFSFAVGISALSALALILLIALALLIIRREANKGLALGEKTYFLTWILKFTPFIWLLLVISLVALAFGFIALGLFIVGNVLETAMLAVVLGVLHAFAHAVSDAAASADTRTGKLVRRFTRWSEEGIGRAVLIFRTVTDIGTSVLALLGLGALWAVSLLDFTTVVRNAASGFEVGNISISPGSLLAALLILLIGIVITRYVTGWLQNRVLSATKLDKGVQDSVRTTAGYSGYALAAGVALSAAGVNFSSLALIAGALGVGIGLGLQSIVTNFVSGLILLAERPVRVGDWIVTAAGEGIVKRINVRATEIETFDRSSIIIPNSNLIVNAVRNWTLRDTIGHFTVPVSVSYDGKPDDIVKSLIEIAAAHPKTMRHPGPSVTLAKLTPQAMEFEVGGQVRNVLDAAEVASDLRLEIVRVLGKKLLHIPAGRPEGGKVK
jgi:small-conductance mechanosensitive channel